MVTRGVRLKKKRDYYAGEVWEAMAYKNPYKWVEILLWFILFIMFIINIPIHRMLSYEFILLINDYVFESLDNSLIVLLIFSLFGGFTYLAVLSSVLDLLDIIFNREVHFTGTKIMCSPYNINHQSRYDLTHPRGRRLLVHINGKNKTLFLYYPVFGPRHKTFAKDGNIGDEVEGIYLKRSKIIIKYKVAKKYLHPEIPPMERKEWTKLVRWWNT